MEVLVDSREKVWGHIRDYFDMAGVDYRVQKLDFGDYMIFNGEKKISVDRKKDLDEVAKNLCTRDDSRFWREIRNARKAGIEIVVLVEHSRNVKTVQDVRGWVSHWHKITGNRLVQEMFNTSVAYGVRWEFCSKAETGRRILEILGWNTDG